MVKGVFLDRSFLTIATGGKEMAENIYHYTAQLPNGFKEMVTPCYDGYTVYTDSRLSREEAIEAYKHAVEEHIINDDFNSEEEADAIESRSHK